MARFVCRLSKLSWPLKVEGTLKGKGSVSENVSAQSGVIVYVAGMPPGKISPL